MKKQQPNENEGASQVSLGMENTEHIPGRRDRLYGVPGVHARAWAQAGPWSVGCRGAVSEMTTEGGGQNRGCLKAKRRCYCKGNREPPKMGLEQRVLDRFRRKKWEQIRGCEGHSDER